MLFACACVGEAHCGAMIRGMVLLMLSVCCPTNVPGPRSFGASVESKHVEKRALCAPVSRKTGGLPKYRWFNFAFCESAANGNFGRTFTTSHGWNETITCP